MQNWKIKKMSKEKIDRWLDAIDNLLRRYEKRINLYGRCPLCFIDPDVCLIKYDCLWHIIEGIHCFDYAVKHGFPNGETRSNAWIKLRIPMLRRWKKIMKAELKRRAEVRA